MSGGFGRFIDPGNVQIQRTKDGEIVLNDEVGSVVLGYVIGALPISNKGSFISLRDQSGIEIGILRNLKKLDERSRRILKEEIERSYFMPKIIDVLETKETLGVETWTVATNKGQRSFQLRTRRQNFRRVGRDRYIVKDVDGNRYEIRKLGKLPIRAQNIIWEYI